MLFNRHWLRWLRLIKDESPSGCAGSVSWVTSDDGRPKMGRRERGSQSGGDSRPLRSPSDTVITWGVRSRHLDILINIFFQNFQSKYCDSWLPEITMFQSRRKKLTNGLSFKYFDQYKILLPQGWEWALDVRGADTAVILRNICQYTSSYISHKYLSTELCHPQTSGLSWISQSDLKSLYWITRLCLHIILYKKEKIYIKKTGQTEIYNF